MSSLCPYGYSRPAILPTQMEKNHIVDILQCRDADGKGIACPYRN